MIKNSEWLDKKYGKFIGRVYILALLFVSNAMLAVGATLHYVFGKSIILMVIGLVITIFSIIILSKPVDISNIK